MELDPAAGGEAVQRCAAHAAELGHRGGRQGHADHAVGIHGDAHVRGQAAGELHGGGDGVRQGDAHDLAELFLGAEDRDVRLALDLHRRQVQRAGVRAAPVGQGHPDEAAAQHLDDPAAGRGQPEGRREHLLQLVAGPTAMRMEVCLCREVRGKFRWEVHLLSTACYEPLLWLKRLAGGHPVRVYGGPGPVRRDFADPV